MNNHITEERMKDLLCGKVPFNEKCEMMAHISACDECSLLFAEVSESLEQFESPKGFSENVFAKIHEEKEPKKKESLSLYTLRVVAAMCAALILLFSGVLTKIDTAKLNSAKEKSAAMTETFNSKMKSFSDKMMYWED